MEDAKVVINLKEGIIEMEGPADFVKQCLDMYGPGIRRLLGLPQDTAAAPEKAGGVPRKRKAAVARPRRGRRATVMATMREDLEVGFFDKPRSTAEIKQRLSDAGLTFTDTGVRANLRKLTQDGVLDAVKKGRSVSFKRRP
ncbi:MAG: hypothetical protein ACNA7X_05230 [Dehalococcoidia bacterium]